MTTFYIGRAEGTAVGRDVTADIGSTITRAEGRAIGFPMLVFGAPPTPGAAPDALRLEILTASGTQLVNDMVARRNLSFSVEHNGSGSVSFETDLSAFPNGIDDAMLDPSNLVRVHYGDLPGWPYGVAEGFITSAPPTKNGDGSWSLTVSCPGSWDVLDFGVLWPPDGATGDAREFSYTAGQTGPSWVPEEWGKPVGKLVKQSFRWKHRWPRGWPESKAQWLWVTSPEKATTGLLGAISGLFGQTCQFVGDPFTLTQKKSVRFHTAGDDTLRLYLNGARIKTKGRGAWKRTTSFVRDLKAGTYTVSSEVKSLAGGDGKSGFILAVEQLKADGSHDKWLLRSSPATFQVKKVPGYFAQVPLPPDGWYPAAVLYQAVGEAAARGVAFHAAITRTFSTTTDSDGSAWTAKGPAEYDIGTSNADLGEKVRAAGSDAAMLPGLRLSAWKHRGFDLRDRVFISAPKGAGWSSRAWPRVRTVGLTHHESGWTETLGDVGGPFGRREMAISGGGVDGDLQADVFAAQAMQTAGQPEETLEFVISSADLRAGAPQPFRDFNLADIVSGETIGGYQPVKVMTISGAEQDDGSVDFTIAGYPV